MKSKFVVVITITTIMSLLLISTGCAASTPQPTPTPEEEAPAAEKEAETGAPYKIGAVFPITGGASSLGIPCRDASQMLAEELNAAGGIKGPDGQMHPLELIIYDTESDETKGVLAAKKLIEEDQVSVIIGPTQSGTTLAMVDTVQKAGIAQISTASSVQIVEPVEERKWMFKSTINDHVWFKVLLDYMQDQGITKVAWMSVNTGYGDSGKAEFEKAAPDHGMEIVTSERFESSDTDMTAQLTKIRGTDAQGLIIWSIPPSAAIATKNAYELGLEIPIFHSAGVGNQAFIDLTTKEAAEGVMVINWKLLVADQLPDSDPQKDVLAKFTADYKAAYDTAPSVFAGVGADAFNLAVLAMEKAGPDRAKIRDEIEKIQGYMGISGIYSMSPSDHSGLDERSLVMIRIEDGKWTLIEE
jgi:branched-chain amino acid transport system substrate-binding protein